MQPTARRILVPVVAITIMYWHHVTAWAPGLSLGKTARPFEQTRSRRHSFCRTVAATHSARSNDVSPNSVAFASDNNKSRRKFLDYLRLLGIAELCIGTSTLFPNLASAALGDDEFELSFGPGPLGIDLTEVRFPQGAPRSRQSSRIVVRAVKEGSQAAAFASAAGEPGRLRPELLVVSVNGRNIEGLPGAKAIAVLQEAARAADAAAAAGGAGVTRIVFRDPLLFKEKLLNSKPGTSISTQVGALGEQELKIEVISSPPVCGAIRAQYGDLLEVKYTGYLKEGMEVFDGSSINAQGGYLGDLSIFFVLEVGQRYAPRAWEAGMLGMCIGERRRLTVPPALGYGAAGVPKGKILPKLPVPPNATLVYDLQLVGINGINVPTDDETAQGTRVPYNYRDCKTDDSGRTVCGANLPGRNI